MAEPTTDFHLSKKDLRLTFVFLILGLIGTVGGIIYRDWLVLIAGILLIIWPVSHLVLHFRQRG